MDRHEYNVWMCLCLGGFAGMLTSRAAGFPIAAFSLCLVLLVGILARRIEVRAVSRRRQQPRSADSAVLTKMSPEKRALFESIKARREKCGPVDFDIVRELREMRGG